MEMSRQSINIEARLSEADIDRLADKVAERLAKLLGNAGVKEVMNAKEAAEFLCLSEQSIRRLSAVGELPHGKGTNGRNYYRRSELEEWRYGRKVRSNAEAHKEAAAMSTAVRYKINKPPYTSN